MAALISCPYDALPHLLFAAEHFHHATVVAHFRLQQWFLAAASFQVAVDVCFQLFAPTYDCSRNNFVGSICQAIHSCTKSSKSLLLVRYVLLLSLPLSTSTTTFPTDPKNIVHAALDAT